MAFKFWQLVFEINNQEGCCLPKDGVLRLWVLHLIEANMDFCEGEDNKNFVQSVEIQMHDWKWTSKGWRPLSYLLFNLINKFPSWVVSSYRVFIYLLILIGLPCLWMVEWSTQFVGLVGWIPSYKKNQSRLTLKLQNRHWSRYIWVA